MEALRWEYLLTTQVSKEGQQKLDMLIKDMRQELNKAVDLLDGKQAGRKTGPQSEEPKIPPTKYLEVLGEQSFSSLNEIVSKLKSVTQELYDNTSTPHAASGDDPAV